MSFLDRLRSGRYGSPSGKEFTFDFDDLSRSGGKKHAVHELPQQDKSIVQDVGQSTPHYPIKAYLSGADYDKTADAFWLALGEPGAGTLKHPRWGDLPVLAVTFSQGENFVAGLGQAIFDIDFVYAPAADAPSAVTLTPDAIKDAALAVRIKLTIIALEEPSAFDDLAQCKTLIKSALSSVKSKLLAVVGAASSVGQKLTAEINSVLNDIDAIASAPGQMAAAINAIISAPIDAVERSKDMVKAYSDAASSLFSDTAETPAQACIQIVLASSLFSSASEASVSGTITSRADAILVRDTIAALSDTAREAIEAAEESSGFAIAPELMTALATLAATTSTYLLTESYSLQIERRTTLDGEATPLDLIWDFYGEVTDDRLDEFIDQNGLEGDSIMLIPAGTEVKYFDR